MPRWRWITFDELREREPEWGELSRASEFPIAFADPAWLLSWWRHYGKQEEPWTLTLEDADGSLLGLAALALARSPVGRRLMFAGGSWNGLQTLVNLPGYERELSGALIQALLARRAEWDLWRIARLPADSTLARQLLGGDGPLRSAAHDLRLQPYVELPGDAQSFEATFSAKHRGNRRRQLKRLSELGASARTVDDPQQVAPALHALLALRRQRAIEQNQRYRHMDERYERFLLEAVQAMVPERALLWVLELDGELLASRLNLAQGAREHSYLIAVGEGHHKLSPGSSLELHAIRGAIAAGRTELELGPGRDEYKYRLGGRDRELVRLVVSSSTARGRAVTALAAGDLRLRNSAAAELIRRQRGIASERPGRNESPRETAPRPSPAGPTPGRESSPDASRTPPVRSRGRA
jgi:CelD/BcsL family acetyltransferase involved in cellulose biosynthesis